MAQIEQDIKNILRESENLEDAIKALKSLVYVSYKNGLKRQGQATAEAGNKFYQTKDNAYEDDF